jgi:hypothetical protein
LFTEMKVCWKTIFKRGYEEIRDRKLLEILKKDRTWLKYELHCNIKTPAPLFFQNNLTFVIQMLINVFPRIVFVRTFFLHISPGIMHGLHSWWNLNSMLMGFFFQKHLMFCSLWSTFFGPQNARFQELLPPGPLTALSLIV